MGEEILVKVCLGAQLAWEFVRSRTVHVAPVYNGVAFALCHNWVKDWWILLVLFLFTRLNIWLRKFSFVLRYLRKVLLWKICFNQPSCLSIFCHQTTSVPAYCNRSQVFHIWLHVWSMCRACQVCICVMCAYCLCMICFMFMISLQQVCTLKFGC